METAEMAVRFLAESKWMYLAYVLPLFIFLIAFYLRNKKLAIEWFILFVKWIKESVESGGMANAERLTAFGIMVFCVIPGHFFFFKIPTVSAEHWLWLFTIDFAFILILYKIITPSQLLELKGIVKTKEQNTTEVNEPSETK